ncbi:hypothetical protein FQA39_LY07811 [Lamprigera yunnana]|nr:hypothetical protein FQA39_LY07811 [Lamprigera yunnana]
MLINKNTKILSENVILVPYRKEHVKKYHEWMQSEELQYLTASEPLTLEEEYQMQISWMTDDNKCTFIILDRNVFDKTQNEVDAMIGDTNLFFSDCENKMVAEAEIMIAMKDARGSHKGWKAMLLMLLYGIHELNVHQYTVKIIADNNISINMFEKMGFVITNHNNVFNEVILNKVVDDSWISWLKMSVGQFQIINENDNYFFYNLLKYFFRTNLNFINLILT